MCLRTHHGGTSREVTVGPLVGQLLEASSSKFPTKQLKGRHSRAEGGQEAKLGRGGLAGG